MLYIVDFARTGHPHQWVQADSTGVPLTVALSSNLLMRVRTGDGHNYWQGATFARAELFYGLLTRLFFTRLMEEHGSELHV